MGQHSSVFKDEIIIPVLIKIVLESQGFEGKDQKTNVYKNRATIKVFGRIRMAIAMFIKLGREFQCFEGQSQNFNVSSGRRR